MWHCTDFHLARAAEKLQVLVTILRLVFVDDLFHIVADLGNSWGSWGAKYSLQLLVKFILQPGVPSDVKSGKKETAILLQLSNVSQITVVTFKTRESRQLAMIEQKDMQKGRVMVHLIPTCCSGGSISSVVWSWFGTVPPFSCSLSLPSSVRSAWICDGSSSSPSKPAAPSPSPRCRADWVSPHPTRELLCPLQLGKNLPECLKWNRKS